MNTMPPRRATQQNIVGNDQDTNIDGIEWMISLSRRERLPRLSNRVLPPSSPRPTAAPRSSVAAVIAELAHVVWRH